MSLRTRWISVAGAARVAQCAMVLAALAACGGGGSDQPTGPGAATRVAVSVSSLSLSTIGGSEAVSASARDANGNIVSTAAITWSSDNTVIATVTASGGNATITARAPGNTIIHARSGSLNADIAVQVLGVRAIQVNPTAATIRVGDFQSFSATFDADQGVPRTVTWSVDNPVVASVNTFGDVTGIAPGTAVVRATSVADPRISSTATITVTPARSIIINPATLSMATADTRTFTATVNIEPGMSTAVTWRSSATAIATVSAAGLVRAIAFGTATITAVSTADTTLRGTAIVSVVPVIRSVTVTPATATVNGGSTQQLTAAVVAEGSLATTVSWRTSDPAIATVSGSGLVTGVAVGSATITALSTVDTTKRATASISVAPRQVSVSIIQRIVNLNSGGSITLNANVSADAGVSTAVTWSSATPSVATINQSGVVNALAGGSTLITATSAADNTKRDTVTVNVVPRLASTWTASRLSGSDLYDDLISIVAFNPTNAFAINLIDEGTRGGDIYRWNGAAWTLSTTGQAFNTQFLAVHGTSSTNVIAVGTNGVIARWNGTSWTAMTSGTTRILRSVWMEGDASAFAVGDNGTALRLTGTTWAGSTTGVTAQLNGVWSNAGTAYAVGAGGVVVAFNGTTWTRQTVPCTADINAVTGVGSSVTAVGNFGCILRFDGTSWTLVNANGVGDNFYAVHGTTANSNRLYIGGDRGVYALNGTTLTSANASYPVATFAVYMDFSGVTWTAGQRGAVQRLTGGSWETLNFAPDLLDVWSTSAANAWTVGEFGFVYRWTGTTWNRTATPSLASLYAVWAPSASEAFAGGDNGTMLRWNGSSWSAMSFPSAARVFAIWGSSPSNVFAATDFGELLRYNGSTWTLQATAPGSPTLLALHGVSANELYATGMGGVVMRYNGTTWSTIAGPDGLTTLSGVWMSGGNNIITVGANQAWDHGFAFNFNGTAWQGMGVGNAKALTSVWGPGLADLYATGDGGTMMRYNGSAWQVLTTGTTDMLWAVTGAPDASGGAFAVGINSTVVTGSGGSGIAAGAMAGNATTRRGSLEPSAAARRDQRASGPAPRGEARKNRAALRRGNR